MKVSLSENTANGPDASDFFQPGIVCVTFCAIKAPEYIYNVYGIRICLEDFTPTQPVVLYGTISKYTTMAFCECEDFYIS